MSIFKGILKLCVDYFTISPPRLKNKSILRINYKKHILIVGGVKIAEILQ
jgi:hypothetical protein